MHMIPVHGPQHTYLTKLFFLMFQVPRHLPILLVPVGDMLGRMFCFEPGGCGFLSFRKEKKHKKLINCWLGLG